MPKPSWIPPNLSDTEKKLLVAVMMDCVANYTFEKPDGRDLASKLGYTYRTMANNAWNNVKDKLKTAHASGLSAADIMPQPRIVTLRYGQHFAADVAAILANKTNNTTTTSQAGPRSKLKIRLRPPPKTNSYNQEIVKPTQSTGLTTAMTDMEIAQFKKADDNTSNTGGEVEEEPWEGSESDVEDKEGDCTDENYVCPSYKPFLGGRPLTRGITRLLEM